MSNFTKVSPNVTRGGKYMTVGSTPGAGYLSSAVMSEHVDADRLDLYVDEDEREIAVEPSEDGDYTISQKDRSDGGSVSILGTIAKLPFDMDDIEESVRCEMDRLEGEMIIFDIEPLYEEAFHYCHRDGCEKKFKTQGSLTRHVADEHEDHERDLPEVGGA